MSAGYRCVSIAAIAVGVMAIRDAQSDRAPIQAVVAAGAAYVQKYQQSLTHVVADEKYTQRVIQQVPPDPASPRWRELVSEIFFMFMPGDGEWIAIRDVLRADGADVGNRPVILDELRRSPIQAVTDLFKQHNSRFNLGRTIRNFNEPTLSLLVLTEGHLSRFSFIRQRFETRAGTSLVTISFRESDQPNLIRDLTYGPVRTEGEFSLEPDTGRIHRARLIGVSGPVRFELTTTYALDDRLQMWVPSRFTENYRSGKPPAALDSSTEYEEIEGDARYTNYRRFQATGRIKK